MAVTETTTESWGSRISGSFKGVIGGLALFIGGFPVLFWNEGNSVKTAKAIDEGEGACVSVESNAKCLYYLWFIFNHFIYYILCISCLSKK